MAEWANRIVGQGEAPADTLMPHPLNWRGHPGFQRAAMTGVLDQVGWVQQVIVNRTTGHLLDGHLRVDMARERGEMVPYLEVELTEDEEMLVLATLDPLTGLAIADQGALDALLSHVTSEGEGIDDLLSQLADVGQPIAMPLRKVTLSAPSDDMRAMLDYVHDYARRKGIEGESHGETIGRAVCAIVRELDTGIDRYPERE